MKRNLRWRRRVCFTGAFPRLAPSRERCLGMTDSPRGGRPLGCRRDPPPRAVQGRRVLRRNQRPSPVRRAQRARRSSPRRARQRPRNSAPAKGAPGSAQGALGRSTVAVGALDIIENRHHRPRRAQTDTCTASATSISPYLRSTTRIGLWQAREGLGPDGRSFAADAGAPTWRRSPTALGPAAVTFRCGHSLPENRRFSYVSWQT